jgi:hypothetical protein
VGGGSGYTLIASAAGLTNAISAAFDITNPVPAIASMSPYWVRAGVTAFVLRLSGASFVPDSKVLWNDSARTTRWVSAGVLEADIGASDVASQGTAEVKVSYSYAADREQRGVLRNVVDLGLYDSDGVKLETMNMMLPPYSNRQINGIFQGYAPVNGYVDVRTYTPGAWIYCYGSVLDNTTSDPTTVPPM